MAQSETVNNVTSMGKTIKQTYKTDCGYCWVVLAACFVANMFQFGYQRAFGLLFVKFREEFQAPASYTSIIMGLFEAIFSIASLFIMGVMLDYWSIRGYAMVGAALSAAGVALSAFAVNVEYLIFSHSILVGIGYAFSFGPGFVLIARNFKKRRGIAFAIFNAGVSAGGMVTPIIISVLLDNYGLQKCLLIFGGIMCLVIVCAALYTDPDSNSSQCESETTTDQSLNSFNEEEHQKRIYIDKDEGSLYFKQDLWTKESSRYLKVPCENPQLYHSDKTLNQNVKVRECELLKATKIDLCYSEPNQIHKLKAPSPVPRLQGTSNYLLATSTPSLAYNWEVSSDPILNQETLSQKLKNILDLSLFKSPTFWIFAAFTAFARSGLVLGETYIPALAEENGLNDQQASLLLCVIGGLDIVFRIVPGVLIEFGLLKAQHIVIVCLLVLGTVFQLVMYLNTFVTLMVLSCIYGVLTGSFFTLFPVILIDLMGFEKFGKVFGFVQIFNGASSFIFFPVIGGLKDLTDTYNTCFHFLGGCMILGAIILSLEPLVRRRCVQQTDGRETTLCDKPRCTDTNNVEC